MEQTAVSLYYQACAESDAYTGNDMMVKHDLLEKVGKARELAMDALEQERRDIGNQAEGLFVTISKAATPCANSR